MPSLAQKRSTLSEKLQTRVPLEIDPDPEVHGVLLSDKIARYSKLYRLIDPFDPLNLKPAAYELTLGDECFISGQFTQLNALDRENDRVVIPPFDVVVLKTSEILCLPRFIIARWNIKVRHAYSGLLWVGGPQVDPGYVGYLYCPIYNLSDKEVTLQVGDQIAVIDFEKTTPFDHSASKEMAAARCIERYPFPPARKVLEDYGIDELRSALFTKAGAKLVEFEEVINRMQTRFDTFTLLSFGVFALILTLVVASTFGVAAVSFAPAIMGAATIAIAFVALAISAFSYGHRAVTKLVYEQYGRLLGGNLKRVERSLGRIGAGVVIGSLLIAISCGAVIYRITEPVFSKILKDHLVTESQLSVVQNWTEKQRKTTDARMEQMESREVTRDELEKAMGELRTEFGRASATTRSGRAVTAASADK